MKFIEDDYRDDNPLRQSFFSPTSLSDEDKIRAIVSSWLDYLRLEELTNAKVDAIKYERPYIWDKGVSLIGNHLIIDKPLFQKLKQNYKSSQKNNSSDEYKFALSFPQILKFENNQRKFFPLFTIDLSSIFSGNYRTKGWDLTQFEFHPVLPNLIKLYKIEEEEASKLPTREGLKVFLESTFNLPFSTLQDFLQLITLPTRPFRSKPLPYLLNFDYISYSHHLKKDFLALLEQTDWSWAVPNQAAYDYLFSTPSEPDRQKVFLGAFPIHPPSVEQALALKHAFCSSETVVFGPPGHGKTRVAAHLIAQQTVHRAALLAIKGIDNSNLTVVASTNNRAVTNVEALLDEKLSTDFFYLSQAGSESQLIDKKVIPKLQKALTWLSETTFNLTEWEAKKQQLIEGLREIKVHQEQDKFYQRQRTIDSEQLAQCQVEIEKLKSAIEEQTKKETSFRSTTEEIYAQFPTEVITRIAQQLELAWRKLSRKDPTPHHWYQKLVHRLLTVWRFFRGQTERQIIARLNQTIAPDVALTKNTPFPLELILNRHHLAATRTHVLNELTTATQWQNGFLQDQRKVSQREDLKQELIRVQRQQQDLKQRLASYPTLAFEDRFFHDYHELQVQLFKRSFGFLQQEALRRKDDIIFSIKTYIDVLNNDWDAKRQFRQDGNKVYRDISLLFPVFFSTLHSIRRLFPYLHHHCIDQAIIDEAGQISVHLPFPLLVRSRRAMFLGDPWQLEPVKTFSDEEKDIYREKAFLTRGLTDSDFDRYSPTSCTAYHRAAGGSAKEGDLGNSITLKQHYRCVPEIARFCASLCYPDMEIKTSPKSSLLGKNLIACHVEGTINDHVNVAEIDRVEALIEELLEAGYCLSSPENHNTIGVISPYRLQADAITERLQSRWGRSFKNSLGTVHRFQGGQKSVIILSTRQCEPTDSLWFINRRPNLLNVAVSRARELFILVGNLDVLLTGDYTKQLVEYIEQFGEVR